MGAPLSFATGSSVRKLSVSYSPNPDSYMMSLLVMGCQRLLPIINNPSGWA
jgi:hypothetical protein